MAISDNACKSQNLLNKIMGDYKKYIAKAFIDKFGKSYQTPEQFENTWFLEFQYTQEREEFLKFQTIIFIHMLPDIQVIYADEEFLKTLVRALSEYLAQYTCRRLAENGHKVRYSACVNMLFEDLFYRNPCIKQYNRYMKRLAKQQEKEKQKQLEIQREQLFVPKGYIRVQASVLHADNAQKTMETVTFIVKQTWNTRRR